MPHGRGMEGRWDKDGQCELRWWGGELLRELADRKHLEWVRHAGRGL